MVTKSTAISTATVSVSSHCPPPPRSAVYTVRTSHRKGRYVHIVQYFGARGCAPLVPSQYQQIQHPTSSWWCLEWCGLRFHGSQRCRGSIGHYPFSCASNPFRSFRLQTGISRDYWRLPEAICQHESLLALRCVSGRALKLLRISEIRQQDLEPITTKA